MTSPEEIAEIAEIDARGLKCPLPVLKARKRLQGLCAGDLLRLITDDPAALVDVPFFCGEAGHELLASEQDAEGALIFLLRRGA